MKTFNYNKIILIIIFILSALAYQNSFIQDDAFITFGYSKNLVNHGVLNWNVDDIEKVEGYSNFLWMLILTISFVLKIEPVLFSKIIGIFLFIITLYTVSKAGEFLFSDKKYIVFLLIILGSNCIGSAENGISINGNCYSLLFFIIHTSHF